MIRWHLTENRDLAAEYRGEAMRILFQLQNILKTGDLSVGAMNRTYPDGTFIHARVIPGMEMLWINSPFRKGGQKRTIKEILVFLYANPEDKMFYGFSFPESLSETDPPEDFQSIDEDSNINLGAVAYAINKPERKEHIITIGTPYENWDLVQNNLSDDALGKFPITAFWNIPSTCTHAHIRGGSEEAKWGTCGYEGDAIVPPEHYMFWPFRSVLPFSCSAKKRILNPIYGVWIPIRTGDLITWQEDPQYTGIDWGIPGKRNFKLNAALSEALSWRDTLQVSGVGTTNSTGYFTTDGTPAGGYLVVTYGWYPYPSPGFFWKPWYAWLHEIPTFDYFDADSYADAVAHISDQWDLQPRSPYKYRRKYRTPSGEVIENDIFTEILSHVYNPVSSWNSNDAGSDGRCIPDYGVGSEHSYAIAGGGYGASSSGTVYTPIASLGDGKYLYIKNTFAASMSHEGDEKTGTNHEDNFPCNYIPCNQNFQLDCACNDAYYGLPPGWSHHDLVSETWTGVWGIHGTTNNINLTQKLLFDSFMIEQCSNNLIYELAITTYTGSYEWYFAHADPEYLMGGWVCPVVVDSQGSESQNTRNDTEGWTRIQAFIEVLDYDNIGVDTAIVIYKKVTIAHSATFSYEGFGVDVSANDFPYPIETSNYDWTGTRTVTYWIWLKIGNHIEKFQIPETFVASCLGQYGNSGNAESQTGSGKRIYGVSCQINDDFIVYSYSVEDFISGPLGNYNYYSSPINWEDRDKIGLNMNGARAWNKKKMVLGVVKMDTHERAAFDITEFTDRKVYSVGIHESERVEIEN